MMSRIFEIPLLILLPGTGGPLAIFDAVALFTELREVGLKSMVGKEKDFNKQVQWIVAHSQDAKQH